jgi:DNA processing protein
VKENTLKYQIAISLIPGVGNITAKKLIAYSGSIEGVFRESKRNLLKIPGIGDYLAQSITKKDVLSKAEKEIEFTQKYNITTYFYLNKNYPERLKHCEDAPVILFVKGNVNLNHLKILSLVGTRNATPYGKERCYQLVSELIERNHDVLIISGLAYGIDVAAHRAAMKNNLQTVAVLGHGLNTIYPSVHRSVAKEIVNKGALLTEFASNEQPERNNFVKRNRIIAGLSDATIVIESGITGGALITADIANSYNRDVFATPGRVKDKYSAGCNRLIKTNKAALIEGVSDLEYLLGWESQPAREKPAQKKLFQPLTTEEEKIIEILKETGEFTIDQICHKIELPVSKISPILLNLEFSGMIKSLPGKVYTLTF